MSTEIRQFWDDDAATYDHSPSHYPRLAHERAAWAATLRRLLPEPPARVLDVGAGTGFISLILAAQGYAVTALDLSPKMLDELRKKAVERSLEIEVIEADALHPPGQGFDVVVERHLLWTLPDPESALRVWRAAAPAGRLVLVEGSWGGESGLPAVRAAGRRLVARARHVGPDHHGTYSDEILAALPYSDGMDPAGAVRLVESAGWGTARLERLRDVEWAIMERRGALDQLLGTHDRWAVIAGS
ncbi:MAG: class I SAM-dependent methyltransferase [Acidimicrobiales bacterium]